MEPSVRLVAEGVRIRSEVLAPSCATGSGAESAQSSGSISASMSRAAFTAATFSAAARAAASRAAAAARVEASRAAAAARVEASRAALRCISSTSTGQPTGTWTCELVLDAAAAARRAAGESVSEGATPKAPSWGSCGSAASAASDAGVGGADSASDAGSAASAASDAGVGGADSASDAGSAASAASDAGAGGADSASDAGSAASAASDAGSAASAASDAGSAASAASDGPVAGSVTSSAAPQRGQKAWPGVIGAEQLLQTLRSTMPASASGQMRECPATARFLRVRGLGQSPDLSPVAPDSPNPLRCVASPARRHVAGRASATSLVKAALRQAEVTAETASAATHATARARVASAKTIGRKSRAVLKLPMPSLMAIGSWFLAAIRHQSKAVEVPTRARPIATALVAYETTTVSRVEIGRWTICPGGAQDGPPDPAARQDLAPDRDRGERLRHEPDDDHDRHGVAGGEDHPQRQRRRQVARCRQLVIRGGEDARRGPGKRDRKWHQADHSDRRQPQQKRHVRERQASRPPAACPTGPASSG